MPDDLKSFSTGLVPLLDAVRTPLDGALARLKALTDGVPLRRFLHGLADAGSRLDLLRRRLGVGEVCLPIFGPVKSGRSTLLNALAGTYLAEVTSLFTYPCAVTVRHRDAVRVAMARYNGETGTLGSPADLRSRLPELAREFLLEFRRVEERGDPFDPRVHYPEALRRVDIEGPAPGLREIGAALVEMPGLFGRMRFAEDALATESCGSSTCALFTVKADGLLQDRLVEELIRLLGGESERALSPPSRGRSRRRNRRSSAFTRSWAG